MQLRRRLVLAAVALAFVALVGVIAWSWVSNVVFGRSVQRRLEALEAAHASHVGAYATIYAHAGAEPTGRLSGALILFDVYPDAVRLSGLLQPPTIRDADDRLVISGVNLSLPPDALAALPEQATAVGFIREEFTREPGSSDDFYVDSVTVVNARSHALIAQFSVRPASVARPLPNVLAHPTPAQLVSALLALRH
jgi:type VI protein secretion system component VasK